MSDEGQEDRDYWVNRYAEASCWQHGDMTWDEEEADWYCDECQANTEAYLNG